MDISKNKEPLLSFIDEERREKVLSYKREENRLQSLGAGYFIKKYTDSEESLYYNEYHKPFKKGEFFNLSHSREYVVFIKDTEECGIDIEYITEYKEKLIPYAFSLEEQKEIKKSKDFYSSWTRKEALGKANGNGLIDETIKKIPSKEGIITYKDKNYTIKTVYYKDYVISIALLGEYKDLMIEMLEEKID